MSGKGVFMKYLSSEINFYLDFSESYKITPTSAFCGDYYENTRAFYVMAIHDRFFSLTFYDR